MFNSLPVAAQQGFEPWPPTLEPFPWTQYALLPPSPLGGRDGALLPACLPLLFSVCQATRTGQKMIIWLRLLKLPLKDLSFLQRSSDWLKVSQLFSDAFLHIYLKNQF